ncbi:hypothetical protein [uncultured Oceanisphaera sp.]|uniref:hypothetical protein n=1 Tax=uncultured Oceanisphaera sp. TaxID=353858 RepID=UPI002606E59D|nr:hypothetical protein [uncultured Oceanisphaera sp.]
MLRHNNHSLVLFDEVEDVFNEHTSEGRKAWMNQLLESGQLTPGNFTTVLRRNSVMGDPTGCNARIGGCGCGCCLARARS